MLGAELGALEGLERVVQEFVASNHKELVTYLGGNLGGWSGLGDGSDGFHSANAGVGLGSGLGWRDLFVMVLQSCEARWETCALPLGKLTCTQSRNLLLNPTTLFCVFFSKAGADFS